MPILCISLSEDEDDSPSQQFKTVGDAARTPERKGTMEPFTIKCRSNRNCKDLFENREAVFYHVRTYHARRRERTFECHLCKKLLSDRTKIQRHMKSMHNGGRLFRCSFPDCSKIFSQNAALKEHIDIRMHQITFACYLCSKTLGTSRSLGMHMKSLHTHQSLFYCIYCSKGYTQKRYLVTHMQTVHTGTFECTQCSRRFNCENRLRAHMESKHGPKVQYICQVCEKRLSSKRTLKQHLNVIHLGLCRFRCEFVGCTSCFDQKSKLVEHTKMAHKKIMPFKCTECLQEFYYRTHLENHLAFWHGA